MQTIVQRLPYDTEFITAIKRKVDAHKIQLARVAGVSLERLLNFIKAFVGWHLCDKSPVVKPDISICEKVKPTRPKTAKTQKEPLPFTKQKSLPFPKAIVPPSTKHF